MGVITTFTADPGCGGELEYRGHPPRPVLDRHERSGSGDGPSEFEPYGGVWSNDDAVEVSGRPRWEEEVV